MGLTHEQKMLDRPWAAWHAMAQHKRHFELFRQRKLRSFEVHLAFAEARRLHDEVKRLSDAGKDAIAAQLQLDGAMERLGEARTTGDVEPIVTMATHERLNHSKSAKDFDETDVMRAIRDDRIRRDLHMSFLQQSRWTSWGAIVGSLVLAWFALSWGWDHTESLRATYRAAWLEYQDGQPKSLRQKGRELMNLGKRYGEEKREQINRRLDERRNSNEQKEVDLLESIRRKRGE